MAKLYSNLSKIADGVDEAVKQALLETATDIVVTAKQLVPVDSGALRQSIGADPISSTKVRVGSDKEYAAPVEYGGPNSAAQPYLVPSFAQAEKTFEKRVGDAIQRLAD